MSKEAKNQWSESTVSVRKLVFGYPDSGFHLDITKLDVHPGEKVAVIGPSGSGKTTLLQLIAGILVPSTGQVSVCGIPVSELNDAARRAFRIANIGFIFQDFELLEYLHVLDNIVHSYRITNALTLDKAVLQRVGALAARMNITSTLKRKPQALSQGEKQRVAICRAMLPGPSLILADEATGNLDPENKIRILELLFESIADQDAALLAVTHDHDLLPRFDRVIDFRDFRTNTD